MTTYIKEILLLCLFFCAAVFSGCSDDKDETLPLPQGQGEAQFKFVRNSVYTISTLEDMVRLKITLEKDGKRIILPTIDLTGDKDSLSTAAIRLENGTYKVVKYISYNNKGAQVQEAYLDEDNTLEVVHGQINTFYFPISIHFTYVDNLLRNKLFGICREVFGSDSVNWPKTWRIENEDLLTWENLEFEVDDYGNPTYLATIIFDKKFAGMKKMPEAVAQLTTLEGVQVMDLPEFEELPDGIYLSGISSITIINTSFKEFPKKMEEMTNLLSLTVINSKLKEIPARLAKLKTLRDVELNGNEINIFPAELATGWQELVMLRICNTKLTSLPSNVFGMKKVSTFDLRNNPQLSSLPEDRPENTHMRALILDGCSFTTLPKIANGKLCTLSMANNKLTSLSSTNVNALSSLLTSLILDDNQLNSFPKMESESLIELSLNNCGLSTLPDLSGLPSLSWMLANKNQITQVTDGTFTANKFLSMLDLSGNQTLSSISTDAGFNLVEQEDIQDGNAVTVAKPYYLYCVKVDDCPALTWIVPGTWCCIKNFYIENKPGGLLPERNVIVYNRNSPGVTREACTHCGKSSYQLPESLDEYLDKLKK